MAIGIGLLVTRRQNRHQKLLVPRSHGQRGEGLKETKFTLEDLKTKFPKVDVVTVIQVPTRMWLFHCYTGIYNRCILLIRLTAV